MTLPGFSTVTGPAATDAADGVAGYNAVANTTEANFDKWNTWQAKAEASFASVPPVLLGSSKYLLAPSVGWALDTYSQRPCWGRKWGGMTFLALSFLRTGATVTVTAGWGGDISNQTLGVLGVGWRPLRRLYVSANFHAYSPCQVYIDPNGSVVLYTMGGEAIPFVTNRCCIMTALFPNTEVTPYP